MSNYFKLISDQGYGDAEGKPFSDYALRAKKANSRVPDFVPPGAESIPELRNRVKDTFEVRENDWKLDRLLFLCRKLTGNPDG